MVDVSIYIYVYKIIKVVAMVYKRTNIIWWFPKIGLPPVLIHFHRIFHSKPSRDKGVLP